MSNPTSPTSTTERSDILDVLRGFAIFGIFLANTSGFSGYGFLNDEDREKLFTYQSDEWLGYLGRALVEGKFYSLFSLLFGIGFSIILTRNKQKGINPLGIFYRRLAILMLFGAAHSFLLWDGDILLLYALIGLLLPLFQKCTDKALLIWAAALILSPILIDVIKHLAHWDPSAGLKSMAIKTDVKHGITEQNFMYYLYKPGSGYDEVLKWCEGGFFWRYQFIISSNRIPKVLGMFLIGFYVGRKMIYTRLEDYKPLLKKIQRWGYITGIPTSLLFAYFEGDGKSVPGSALGLLDTFFYAVSVVPLSLAYTSSVCLLWLKAKQRGWLQKLAPVGRMALTNYILQSIFGILIYYNLGLGLGIRFGPTIYFPIVIAVYLLQIIYSNFWFRYFQYGPLEWIWRQFTYGKRLPLLKRTNG